MSPSCLVDGAAALLGCAGTPPASFVFGLAAGALVWSGAWLLVLLGLAAGAGSLLLLRGRRSATPRRFAPTNPLYRDGVARTLALAAGGVSAYYLWWRLTSTLNPEAPALSLLMLAAELFGFFSFALFAFMTWDVRARPRFEFRPDWRVDVYVPTYNEDTDLLEATLVGCNRITYPHTTYVLDDGRRPEVAALAARLGCRYLTRPDNRHAKAGNLNAALRQTAGDLIVVLDADTVPQPDLLDKTVGYFADDRMALVQLPQEFYNWDSVQHRPGKQAGEAWHEQALFYRTIQPGKNRWNAAFWCGSPSVVRRAALEAIGGVATETVTEDIHTSLRLHARGWKTVYHPETLAYGIAPQTLSAFTVQRLRWAQGTMQLLRSRENPLILPGLTWAQRLNYAASMFTYFEAYQKLAYLALPLLVLLTGVLPLRVGVGDYLVHWLPYMALGALANAALGRGSFRWWDIERYNILKMFTFIWGTTVLLWPRPLRFRVTPKRADESVRRTEWRLLRYHFAGLGAIGLATGYGTVNLLGQVTITYAHPILILTTLAWALVNAALLTSAAWLVLGRSHRRRGYRFSAALPAVGVFGQQPVPITIEDLSVAGARLTAPRAIAPGTGAILTVPLGDGALTVQADVRYTAPAATGAWQIGCQFRPLAPSEHEKLVDFLFVTVARGQGHRPRIRQTGPASRRLAWRAA